MCRLNFHNGNVLSENMLNSFDRVASSRKDLVVQPEGGSYAEVQAALSQMASDLKDAKAAIPYVVGYDFDVNDPVALKKAKDAFQKSLTVHVIDTHDPVSLNTIKRMYGLYEAIFPIEEEREQLDKLLMVLERQNCIDTRDTVRQHWIVLETPQGEIVGGRYISTFVIPEKPSVIGAGAVDTTVHMAQAFDGTQHLTYSFVDAKYRALGLGDYTMRIAADVGRDFIAQSKPDKDADAIDILRFCEQNNPLLMSVEEFLADTLGAKTDPFWRRNYYQNMGFREIGCDYTQLPLRAPEEGGVPCEILMLLAKPLYGPASQRSVIEGQSALDAGLVKFHIYNTFEHSFAAGQYSVDDHPDWQRQATALTGEVSMRPPLDFNNTGRRAWHMIDFSRILQVSETTDSWPLGTIMNIDAIPAITPSTP